MATREQTQMKEFVNFIFHNANAREIVNERMHQPVTEIQAEYQITHRYAPELSAKTKIVFTYLVVFDELYESTGEVFTSDEERKAILRLAFEYLNPGVKLLRSSSEV